MGRALLSNGALLSHGVNTWQIQSSALLCRTFLQSPGEGAQLQTQKIKTVIQMSMKYEKEGERIRKRAKHTSLGFDGNL